MVMVTAAMMMKLAAAALAVVKVMKIVMVVETITKEGKVSQFSKVTGNTIALVV